MILSTVNKLVACDPVESLAVQTEIVHGVAFVKQKGELVRLRVAILSKGSDGKIYMPDDHVYVDAEQARGQPWSRKVCSVGSAADGKKEEVKDPRPKIILVPEQFVCLHERIERTGTVTGGTATSRPAGVA